ncbi:MAG: GtrA family protein [Erythrobacter sp.]
MLKRFWNRRAGGMLWRNTVVSTSVFLGGLALLWVMVEWGRVDATLATGVTFILSTSVHYIFGRSWIFAGSQRKLASGYAFFFVNAAVGLLLTVGLFWLMTEYTPINYIVVRIIVSVCAGLAVFWLNAVFNFRQL